MRIPLSLFPVLVLASCSPVQNSAPQALAKPSLAAPSSVISTPPKAKIEPPPPAQPRSAKPPRLTRATVEGIDFEGVSFDSISHHLIVVDQPAGPGTRWPDAETAARAKNGIAAINGGFFTPEGAPLGKLVAAGNPAGSWNQSSLGSGVFYESPNGIISIARRQNVDARQRELLQAGPFLIEESRSVGGLSDQKTSARSFIAWDGANRWWIGRASPCSLKSLANSLAAKSPTGFPIRSALNLDGGRSSDLFISDSVSGGPLTRRSFLNRPVRNFLVLTTRN